MKRLSVFLFVITGIAIALPSSIQASSGAVTGIYLMAFHACDTSDGTDCHNPQSHMVYLAQSDDGENWSLIPGWEPYQGSVPDVIQRGNTLYVYTPGELVRYDLESDTLDPPVRVQIPGLEGGYVDPSLIIDEGGNLVMFFLYGQLGMDPAGCSSDEESCVREIGSATEVKGSDGAEFTLDEDQRATITLSNSSKFRSFSDPDIFFDGNQFVLYVSHGPSTSVWVSKELQGEYVLEPSLPDGLLTKGTGGVPSGFFDMATGEYWTYAHIDQNGKTVIRRAVHNDLMHPLSAADFSTVISAESVGLGDEVIVASPGFALVNPDEDAQFGTPGGAPGGQHVPEFNPFENMTAEQESCLRDAWGDDVFEDISTFQRPPTTDEEPFLQECLGDAFMSPGEPGEGPGGGHNAFVDQTFYATSNDGLTWSEGILLADKASVPEVIRTSDGTLWAYWVDFTYMTGPNMERIGIARSNDNGQSWEMLGNAEFTGLGDIVPVDPDAFELPDGRIRMYFYDIAVRQLSHPIYSAISDDGITFTLEEGVRIWMDNIYDPDVIQLPDGSYRMYLNGGDIYSASSTDGLEFTADEGVRVENGSVPGSIVMPDDSIRMYNCAQGITVFESQDGLDFALLKQGVIQDTSRSGMILCDPSVAATDQGFVIVYKVNPGGGQ